MDDFGFLAALLPIGVICGVIGGFIARDKGKGFAFGFIAGLFLGVIGRELSLPRQWP